MQIQQHGSVILSPDKTFPIQSPFLAIANKAMEQMLKILVEFGMTPSSRSRVERAPLSGELDEFERFMETGRRLREERAWRPPREVEPEENSPGADCEHGAGDFVASAEPAGGMAYSRFGNPFGFTGHVYLPAIGKNLAHFRVYDPRLGRWLQRDPIEYAAGSISLYEYVRGSPLGWFDPLGLESFRDFWNESDVQAAVKAAWDESRRLNREIALEMRVLKNGKRIIVITIGTGDHVDPTDNWPNKKKPPYVKGAGHTHQKKKHDKGPSQQDKDGHKGSSPKYAVNAAV